MYIENKSFSWLLEMIVITGNDMYMLLKSTCYFFLLWQASEKRTVKVQADDPISFAQLVNKAEMGATEVQNSNYKDKRSKKKKGGGFQGLKLTSKIFETFVFVCFNVTMFYFSEHVWADIVSSFRNVRQERWWSYWSF